MPGLRALLPVYVALLALLATTLGASYLPLGGWSPVVSTAVALAKAALIAGFFMELRLEGAALRLAVFAGLFMCAILLVMSSVDPLTR
ncbi:cytochrome C oxidase subunit IV family protein [Tianweitania sediminis]|uniref:Cytochrome C oxidase subunit IV family protein n=1 Tax=Tianweitania sediminis TaxID=1502156 RepID=A0A8J7RLS6_9HYPH|nr:cytochrome C oxidase subunit IV family protein [Tianweitania sediminis]MBP0439521.1 cytochrome C oxidase subunit IV family protein [Tianweitania sediminis]